jgi:hypothetical protein
MKYLSSAVISITSALAVSLVAGSAANAAGISYSFSSIDPSELSAFNDGTTPGYTFESSGLSAEQNIRTGSVVFQNAQPAGDQSNYLAVQPDPTIEDGVPGFSLGAVIYNSPTLLSSFSIYWGSADPTNKVEFFNGNTFIKALTGLDVFGVNATGDWYSPDANRYVTFTGVDTQFNKVRFSTGQIAFEFDQKRPVPVPAIVPGIALAAAFFGSKALKRKQNEASKVVA